MPRSVNPSIVVFDIGGVLIDWNPRYLYRKLFAEDTAAMEEFLTTVCTPDWNLRQDAGRPWKEAIDDLSARYPEKAELIAAYDLDWDEMVSGPIPGAADLLWELKRQGTPVYCITNFSVDKLNRARTVRGTERLRRDRRLGGGPAAQARSRDLPPAARPA
jgi:2-haloacid dehalogenase